MPAGTTINGDGRFTPIHANVTDEGRDALAAFCADNGITISGLLQALCDLCVERYDTPDDPAHPLAVFVRAARHVDTSRRQRARKAKAVSKTKRRPK